MRLPELKALARDRGSRSHSRMRKAEFAALLKNNGTPEGPRALEPQIPTPGLPPTQPPQRCTAYVTLKFDDNGSCRIHSVSDGDKEIAPNERYVIMPWKVVNMHGKNGENDKHVTLKEAVHEIISYKESVDKERERREREREEIEKSAQNIAKCI